MINNDQTNTIGDVMIKKYKKEKAINRRIKFVICLMIICFVSIIVKLVVVNVLQADIYNKKLYQATNIIVKSNSVPRGRIYDRNMNLLVDNVATKVIYYKKPKGMTTKKEILLAYKISRIIDLDYSDLTINMIKDFYIIDQVDKAYQKITTSEWNDFENRQLTDDDIYNFKKKRITDSDLSIYDNNDKKAIYLYFLMNKGYYYDDKIIKKENVSNFEYAYIAENSETLSGFNVKEDWNRIYLYGDTFRSILGDISTNETGIPSEYKDYYLDLGYALNDRVGISGLEYQYESILKGEKDEYLLKGYDLELVTEGKRGLDIVLTIDIKLQQEIEKILKEEIKKAKKMANTSKFDHSFVIIQKPNTGEILAMAGKKITKKGNFEDITYAINNETVQPGSIVKGASMIVGYNSGVVKIGSTEIDECIYFKGITKKCSWRTMGKINDLLALKYSSNVFQYKTAIKVGKGKYCYNCNVKIDPLAFAIYRGTFYQFGLGSMTGIDFPKESIGYKGYVSDPSLIIDYAIGQFDTYTPIQLSQYINTIASNGNRLIPHLLKSVYRENKELYNVTPTILNKVQTDDKYLNRIQTGFRAVMTSGTGVGYMDSKYNPSGKTGTSESFIDTNNDGMIDTKTWSKNFIGYAPSKNPEMSIMVTSPNIGKNDGYIYNITYNLSRKCTKAYFDIVK